MGESRGTAVLTLRGKTYEVPAGMTLRAALGRAGISPETILATRDGEMITDDEIVRTDDQIRLVAVISGGSRS